MLTERYFRILRDYFGKDYENFKKEKFREEAHLKLRKKYADKIIQQSLIQTLSEDLEKLNWQELEATIKRERGIKAQYIGSEYGYKEPSAWSTSNFIRKTALYADTIVLEEQVLNQLLHVNPN
jgi:hypothetical protein